MGVMRMSAYWDEYIDDLDTMSNPENYLEDDELDAMEAGFIRGFNSAA